MRPLDQVMDTESAPTGRQNAGMRGQDAGLLLCGPIVAGWTPYSTSRGGAKCMLSSANQAGGHCAAWGPLADSDPDHAPTVSS